MEVDASALGACQVQFVLGISLEYSC